MHDPASEPVLLREPTAEEAESSNIEAFRRYVNESNNLNLVGYEDLWRWSVEDLTGFWEAVWDFCGFGPRSGPVLVGDTMPGVHWFPQQRINLVGEIFRRGPGGDVVALIGVDERGPNRRVSWDQLRHDVRRAAGGLRTLGVQPGDVVAGYLPNIPEAMIAALATMSLGAIWTGVGQDYQPGAVNDRFAQLEPKVLFTADGYCWNGEQHSRAAAVDQIRTGLPTVGQVIVIGHIGAPHPADSIAWDDFLAGAEPVDPIELDFGAPLWVLFSSGTTGLPKGIVQSHGGVSLEMVKLLTLHLDARAGEVLFWWTSPSWIMWNISMATLISGMSVVCYDGAPTYPDPKRLWQVAADAGVATLGLSPGFLDGCLKFGLDISDLDLATLRQIQVTGSPLAPRTHQWTMELTGVPLHSISGGTDICSGFAGGAPTRPIWAGELSCRLLGVSMAAWNDDGNPVVNEVGELVVDQPMPSMPIRFWNDPDQTKYTAAYFDVFPGMWRHGDWVTVTDRDSVIIHGRSDSTLNRGGVRIGSADIYRVVESLPEIAECLVIGAEMPDGSYWMPLFVVLAEGAELSDELVNRIKTTIRNDASPRHVPDEVHAVAGLPHTRTGKRVEVPIKKILQGADPAKAVQKSVLVDESVLAPFIDLAANRRAR